MKTRSEAERILSDHPVIEKLHWPSLRCTCGAPHDDLFLSASGMPGRSRREIALDLIRQTYCTNCCETLPELIDLEAVQAQLAHAKWMDPDLIHDWDELSLKATSQRGEAALVWLGKTAPGRSAEDWAELARRAGFTIREVGPVR